MFNRRLQWLRSREPSGILRGGKRGIEKETLRVDRDGQLSARAHPKSLGSALTHPWITTDYSEALLELVTPPFASNWETMQFLCDTHGFVHRNIADELLWPMSMPCVVNANEAIPIADYGPSHQGMIKTIYRRGLGHRYGRAMQAIAGIHFNYSPPDSLWPALFEHEAGEGSLADFKSRMLMGLVRNYRRFGWLIIYLFGASPACCKSFRREGHELLAELNASTWFAEHATSLRMSDLGYRNSTQARLSISANSLEEYVQGLVSAVTTADAGYEAIGIRDGDEYKQLNANILQIENEYYASIRPKPVKDDRRVTAALRQSGVEYVEVRGLDLNPADPAGINQAQMRFIEALLLYCLLEQSPPIREEERAEIDARELQVAREGRRPGLQLPVAGQQQSLAQAGELIMEGVAAIAALLDEDGRDDYAVSVESCRRMLHEPATTPSARLLDTLVAEQAGFFEYTLGLAESYHEYFVSLSLNSRIREEFERASQTSLNAAEAIVRAENEPFEAYLARYAAAI